MILSSLVKPPGERDGVAVEFRNCGVIEKDNSWWEICLSSCAEVAAGSSSSFGRLRERNPVNTAENNPICLVV